MASETILQHWIFTNFAFPFLLIFFIVFAILEKTKIFGDDKKQLNAMISFIIGLIFVSAVAPKLVVSNLILFLTIAIIVAFVGLLLWGFLAGEEPKIAGDNFKKVVAGVIIVALVIAVIWAAGWWDNALSFFGSQNLASTFWTSLIFIVVIAVAIAVAVKSGGSSSN